MKKFFKRLFKRIKPKPRALESKYFESLSELPIWNWWQLSKTGDLSFLHKEGLFFEEKAFDLYFRLQQEYLDLFGVESESIYLMSLLKRSIQLKCQYMQTGDRSLKNFIDITQTEIDALLKTNTTENTTIESSLVALGQFMGYRIEAKKVSVVEFKEMIKLAERHANNSKNGTNTDKEQ